MLHGLDGGAPPAADLDAAARLHELVADLVNERRVAGVHDCSDGGVAVALAEMAFAGGVGCTVLPEPGLVPSTWCFSESANRVLLSVDADSLPAVLRRARDAGVPAADLGVAGGDRIVVEGAFDVALADAEDAWANAIPRIVAPR